MSVSQSGDGGLSETMIERIDGGRGRKREFAFGSLTYLGESKNTLMGTSRVERVMGCVGMLASVRCMLSSSFHATNSA